MFFIFVESLATSKLNRALVKNAVWATFKGTEQIEAKELYVKLVDTIATQANESSKSNMLVKTIKPKSTLDLPGDLYKVRIAGIGRYLPKRLVKL